MRPASRLSTCGFAGLAPHRHHDSVTLFGLPLSVPAALAVVHHGHHVHPVHQLHQVHGFHRVRAGVDYIGVFVAAAASWVALPGPGEAALIAASISAAHGHLDLTAVVAVAWAGATAGGIAGWIIGMKGGRTLLTASGPLHHVRLTLIARGDRFYDRYGPIAVLFTPSWIAGIHDMRWSRFVPANVFSALMWAVSIGVGAYLIGPSITDIVADAGLVGGIVVAALFVLAAVFVRRRSSSRHDG
jgi:membrane protein DedA with SNARE-associated domain